MARFYAKIGSLSKTDSLSLTQLASPELLLRPRKAECHQVGLWYFHERQQVTKGLLNSETTPQFFMLGSFDCLTQAVLCLSLQFLF